MSEPTGVNLPEAPPEVYRDAAELAERAPLPARVGNILFGTGGWTDKTLIQSGRFYPKGASSSEARLKHYAAHFSFVEVDATYYTLLAPSVVDNWLRWTPDHFRFLIKAHPVFTGHPIDVRKLPMDLREQCIASGHAVRAYSQDLPREVVQEIERRFLASIAPLAEQGRLSAVLLQFPPWFAATRGNARILEALPTHLPDTSLAVEFRNQSWFEAERRDRVCGLLRHLGASAVCTDSPLVAASAHHPGLWITREELAIMRFHGHNTAGWSKKGASVLEKFNYLYAPAELKSWVSKVRELSASAETALTVFNNCVRNYAVLNAKDLAVLIEESDALPGG